MEVSIPEQLIFILTHKQLDTHRYILSNIATGAQVLKHETSVSTAVYGLKHGQGQFLLGIL